MSERLFDTWERLAATPSYLLRNEIERDMVRVSASIRTRMDLDWHGRPRRGSAKRRAAPRLNPTKGYRGAHKLFRGGSR